MPSIIWGFLDLIDKILSHTPHSIFYTFVLLIYFFLNSRRLLPSTSLLYRILFVPGIVIHELAHAVTVILLGGKIIQFQPYNFLRGESEPEGIVGYLMPDDMSGQFRTSLVAISPLFTFFIFYHFLTPYHFQNISLIYKIILWYLYVSITSCMFPSDADLKTISPMIYLAWYFLYFLGSIGLSRLYPDGIRYIDIQFQEYMYIMLWGLIPYLSLFFISVVINLCSKFRDKNYFI